MMSPLAREIQQQRHVMSQSVLTASHKLLAIFAEHDKQNQIKPRTYRYLKLWEDELDLYLPPELRRAA